MMDRLHIDNFIEIFEYLSYQDLNNVSTCNKFLNQVLKKFVNIKENKLNLIIKNKIENLVYSFKKITFEEKYLTQPKN